MPPLRRRRRPSPPSTPATPPSPARGRAAPAKSAVRAAPAAAAAGSAGPVKRSAPKAEVPRPVPGPKSVPKVEAPRAGGPDLPWLDSGHPHFPTPPKAYKNQEFLQSPAARGIRIQCELVEPAIRFKRHRIQHTVVMFGSARLPSPEELPKRRAQWQQSLEEQVAAGGDRAQLAERLRRLDKTMGYYEEARGLAREMTRWSLETIPNPKNRFYICSGGGPGIMEAANRGAQEAGGLSVALGISLPFEQHINAYSPDDLSFEFHYFFIRKYWFFYLAKALVVFPGGYGTMDELFEMLTLIQTQKTKKKVPVILYGAEFWREVLNFPALVSWGVISPDDLHLFRICDSVAEARDHLVAEFTKAYL